MAFKDLRKTGAALREKYVTEADKQKTANKKQVDNRFWQPTVDAQKNGTATIRFLPPKDGENMPWVRLWRHSFKGKTGQWYIENSLTTIGETDPVSEYNTTLWDSGDEELKNQARNQKRRVLYIANILVVSDPKNTQNEGKVFLYSFGQKIFEKIMEAMKPEDPTEDGFNPFDFWQGADFKIVVKDVSGFRNYDKSKFVTPKALFNGDEAELETVYNQLYSLEEFVNPKNFKSYDELKKRLNRVLGLGGSDKPALKVTDGGKSTKSATKSQKVEVEEVEDTDTSSVEDDTDELLDELDELADEV